MVGNELHEQTPAAHESQAVPGVHGAGVIVLELWVVVPGVVVSGGVGSGVAVSDVVVLDVVESVGVGSTVTVSNVVVLDVVESDVVVLGVVESGVGLIVLEIVLGGCETDSFV